METITIFSRQIPVYGMLGVIGVLLGIAYLLIVCKVKGKNFDDTLYIFLWGCVSAMIGAKILYLLININQILNLLSFYPNKLKEILWTYFSGGFVFYGGLIGAIIGVILASKYFSFSPLEQLNLCIPLVPLIHGFGRIGCHLVGCCYGAEYFGPLAINYSTSLYAPNGVPLFPVQLIESILDFVLFVVLTYFFFKSTLKNNLIYIYLLSYSVIRFVLEFFRGDSLRGFLGVFSTSQWISISIWLVLLIVLVKKRKSSTA